MKLKPSLISEIVWIEWTFTGVDGLYLNVIKPQWASNEVTSLEISLSLSLPISLSLSLSLSVYISSSSCRAGSTDIPDPLSPLLPIVHRLGRSSVQHPVSSHSCWMYVRAGRPAFARPCVGVHKSTSLMSSSLLLQQCPACLVRLTWFVFVIGGRWPYSWCLVGCCRHIYIYIINERIDHPVAGPYNTLTVPPMKG